MKAFANTIALCLAVVTAGAAQDRWKQAVAPLAASECIHLSFISTLESNVFGTVDTTLGSAYLGTHGCFYLQLGPDEVWSDGERRYTYSPENSQLIIEQVDTADYVARGVSLLRCLDSLYRISRTSDANLFRLDWRSGQRGEYPDSLWVRVSSTAPSIRHLEYFDDNGDRNGLDVRTLTPEDSCATSRFVPNLPDSVERVRLPQR